MKVFQRSPRRARRTVVLTASLALALGGLVTFGTPAMADTASGSTALSGSADLGTKTAVYDNGDVHAEASVSTSIDWSQPALIGIEWDPNLVRQGRSLDPTVSYTRPVSGSMSATYSASASGCFDYSGTCYGLSFGPVTFTASGFCDLRADGSAYDCDLSSTPITVLGCGPEDPAFGDPFIPACPKVTVRLDTHVTVTPDGLDTLRTATLAGEPAGTNALTLLESGVVDPLAVSCTAGVGDMLGYSLGEFSTSPQLTAATSLVFDIYLSEPFVPTPIGTWPYIHIAEPSILLDTASGTADITGAGVSFDLGAVQANNIPPVLTVASSFSGSEGSPISFAASATGPCAAGASYVWQFSDGTSAFGASPQKTFADSGPFSGSVTVTDTTGLTDTNDFTVSVANLDPQVVVIPTNPTVAWGRDLTISAQALDPGAGDQPYLTYAWDFGDATPIVIGGATETHQWSTPGSYSTSVTVCDDDGGCTTDGIGVTVRKRDTSVAYTGDNSGVYSATTTLAGSLVDEYGSPVNAATLEFSLGGAAAGTATTNSSGVAARSHPVTLTAGGYEVAANFAGSALYTSSSSSVESYQVVTMATSIAYTGALGGKPNKVVPLSAKLIDFLGRPLSGKTVNFQLGTQSVSAVTDGDGVASVELKLDQKPGTYALTVSWSGEASRYTGTTTATSFKLNTK